MYLYKNHFFMPVKNSEKQLFPGVVLFLVSVAIFLNTALFNAPVKISETGLLFDFIAVVLLCLSARAIYKSIQKQ